jgi:hypothetical protein
MLGVVEQAAKRLAKASAVRVGRQRMGLMMGLETHLVAGRATE